MGYENPLLKLPAMRQVMALPPEQRGPLEALMRELRADADRQAEESWRKRKGPMAAYWRAVSTYARHVAHALSKGHQVPPGVPAVDPAQPFTEPGERRWSRVMEVMGEAMERAVRAFDTGSADDYGKACIAFDDALAAELDRVTTHGVSEFAHHTKR